MGDEPAERDDGRNAAGQWVPGVSGNPAGSARGYVKLGQRLQRRLGEDPQTAEALVERLIRRALDDDDRRQDMALRYLRTLLDRHDGAVPRELHVSGEVDSKLVHLVDDETDAASDEPARPEDKED